jgi:hypothetical protein
VSMYASGARGSDRAEVEVFGPGGSAAVDGAAAVDNDTYATMIAEFAAVVRRQETHHLDVRRGLHLQQVVEAAAMDLVSGV